MKILGIETSCDETAAAVVENGTLELCSVVASSKELHEKTGGVVPEVASRKQVEFILPVIDECLNKFYRKVTSDSYKPVELNTLVSQSTPSYIEYAKANIDAIAVTVGPGLVGSLMVGIEAAKTMALLWEKPLIAVNHLVGHLYANFISSDSRKRIEFPALGLLVSGGHTDLVLIKNHGDFEYLGGTLDDAAGECFDKTARILGLANYLGGRLISEKAASCQHNNMRGVFPRPMLDQDNYDFSFSGLKTAVKRYTQDHVNFDMVALCCEFETAVVDVLVEKTVKALKAHKVKSLLLGGGVAANTHLRQRLKNQAESHNVAFFVPSVDLCTDNAVYIATAAYFNKNEKRISEITANPSLGIMSSLT